MSKKIEHIPYQGQSFKTICKQTIKTGGVLEVTGKGALPSVFVTADAIKQLKNPKRVEEMVVVVASKGLKPGDQGEIGYVDGVRQRKAWYCCFKNGIAITTEAEFRRGTGN